VTALIIPKAGVGTNASARKVTMGTHTSMGVAKVRTYYIYI
jgi:hypothetical protein